MISKNQFIRATAEYNTLTEPVPAHYFRRSFNLDKAADAKLTVAVCGFYELFLDGEKITRGFLSPYISNPNHYVYSDEYELSLSEGEHVIGLILGNGFQNNPGGHVWDFHKADFRSAPMLALALTIGDAVFLKSDESFKIHPSPIRFDDYRFGEHYDANYEIDDWSKPSFDDSSWDNALHAPAPMGEIRIADTEPIRKICEIKPKKIVKRKEAYFYDFGISEAGICRLTVNGNKGQKISLTHADSYLSDESDLDLEQIICVNPEREKDKLLEHKDVYVCSGKGVEIYEPSFTYHGFRYVKVEGIADSQATEDLLKFLVYHTDLAPRGDFSCSDSMANTLQEITKRSILSNFHHIPTDCPQREKNGWTADAALTTEAALLNFNPERNYREWLRNICKAQREDGALPGIVPTGGWGFHWGNGPAWDCVLVTLPYFAYIYRGNTDMIREAAPTVIRYLKYLRCRCDGDGLLSIGLGDWCQVGGGEIKAPLTVTDSIIAMDIARKSQVILEAAGDKENAAFAKAEKERYRNAIREKLVDESMTVLGNCQSCQAMALYYGVFDEDEKPLAFKKLLELIHGANDSMDVGVGGRVIFHVLSEFGESDLAFHMITKTEYPSYGNWVMRGATTLWENFLPDRVDSKNHHFWGDISAWFIKRIAGIVLNPQEISHKTLKIAPHFIKALDYASAYHIAPEGKISVSWTKKDGAIYLDVEIPEAIEAAASLEEGYRFCGGSAEMPIKSGRYKIIRI